MDRGIKARLLTCIVVTVVALWLLGPTLWRLNHANDDAEMPSYFPNTAMGLGLDLRGGVHMVLGVDLDTVVREQLSSYGRSLEKTMAEAKVIINTKVDPGKYEIEITTNSEADREATADKIERDFTVLEFVGGSGNILVSRMSRDQESYIRDQALNQSIETIRNRIDEFGVAEPIISKRGNSQILVQFPGVQNPERLKALIGRTAQLNFRIVHECGGSEGEGQDCLAKQRADLAGKINQAEQTGNYTRDNFETLSAYRAKINADLASGLPADTEVFFERVNDTNVVGASELIPYLLSTKNFLSGEYIEDAFVQINRPQGSLTQQPVVAFDFNPVGGPLFGQMTTEFAQHYMAIVLDDIVKSAPRIRQPITGGSGIIEIGSGRNFEVQNQEARDLAIVLRAGALPATMETQEERVIGPSIGEDAIRSGKQALAIASIAIFAFMFLYYGVSGLLANFAILVNVALIFSLLGAVSATLTLPGIAGIVLTIGMAVDALIIIFERMREEVRSGRNKRQVISLGFDRAFSTILDSNITTAIGAFVLLQYGSGPVRGFALTLLIGILSNVFIATFFTKTLFELVHAGSLKLKLGMSSKELKTISETA